MRNSANLPTPGPPAAPGPSSDKSGAGVQKGPDAPARSSDAPESTLATIRERVSRLEDSVRNLQSQNLNRS